MSNSKQIVLMLVELLVNQLCK